MQCWFSVSKKINNSAFCLLLNDNLYFFKILFETIWQPAKFRQTKLWHSHLTNPRETSFCRGLWSDVPSSSHPPWLQGIPFFLQEHLCDLPSPLHPHLTIFSSCSGAGPMSVSVGKTLLFLNIHTQSRALNVFPIHFWIYIFKLIKLVCLTLSKS